MIPTKREATDLAELLQSSLAPLIAQAHESRIDLRVATLGSIPKVKVDREKLAWAVATIVGNALRYVQRGEDREAGGSVVVHLHADDERARRVSIAVQDDGPGMPPEKASALFERGDAIHAPGLSLSLVREVVLAHDGTIRVDSRLGEGTSITLSLPVTS